jgi:hypothetical protein
MKTTLTVILAAGLSAGSTFAQGTFGTVFLNNYDGGAGNYLGFAGAPAPAGTIVEVLGGPNLSALTPIASTRPGNPTTYTITIADMNANGPGTGSFFDYGFGEVNGVAPAASATLVARAWLGAPTYDAATVRGTATWTQTIGTAITPPLPAPATLRFPGLVMVPEPSAIVIAVLGAFALLLRRRR